MNVWQQLDSMQAKFKKDHENAEAAAKAYKFVALNVLPHGEWMARSAKSAKHSVSLRAPSADQLVEQMKSAFEKAQAKS